MKFNSASPFFSKNEVKKIILGIKELLNGKGLLAKGPLVGEFEKLFSNYVGSKYGVAVNSGTSALEIVLKAIDINNNDEVIIPTQTFVSTASSVLNNGGKPIFCEIDNNHLIDFKDLKRKVTNKTKAVIIVHFCGLIHPEINEIKNYCERKNIILIEDAAHAHGAKIKEKYAGSIGHFGCFSFFSTKIMTTGGEGGFITTDNLDGYNKCKSISAIGIDLYTNSELYSINGSNNRMTEIQSIIGISQLNEVENFINHRISLSKVYKKKLNPLVGKGIISFQDYPDEIRHPYWKFMVIFNHKLNRVEIKNKLNSNGIAVDWPYQPLLHLQPLFKNLYNIKKGFLKKSEELSTRHLCLPIHKNINIEGAEFISEKLIECL